MRFELSLAVGDHPIDLYQESGFSSINYVGMALQSGGVVAVGSGGLQIATDPIEPDIAFQLSFEPMNSGCPPLHSGSGSGDPLPFWSAAAPIGAPWTFAAVLQLMVICDPVLLKFQVLGTAD